MSGVAGERRVALGVALAALLAWLLLFVADGRLLHLLHGAGASGAGGGGVLARAVTFGCAWLAMTVAMMLPTTVPLLRTFGRVTAGRPNRGGLVGLVVTGYLGAWLLFGALAGAGVVALRAGLRATPAAGASWLVPAALLALAGAYQFSPLKDRCLDRCRSPFLFVARHWRGGSEGWQSLRLGLHHGLFCLGCCWALMLLMFAFGAEGVGWMLVLAALMAVEKNTAWGRALVRPAGAVLLLGSAWIAVAGAAGLRAPF